MPDFAIMRGSVRGQSTHPTNAGLVIEISDTTLNSDTTEKMSLYAAAGIPEYWIVDINDRQLIVHHNPIKDASAPFDFRYADVRSYGANEFVTPLAIPDVKLTVGDMLP